MTHTVKVYDPKVEPLIPYSALSGHPKKSKNYRSIENIFFLLIKQPDLGLEHHGRNKSVMSIN